MNNTTRCSPPYVPNDKSMCQWPRRTKLPIFPKRTDRNPLHQNMGVSRTLLNRCETLVAEEEDEGKKDNIKYARGTPTKRRLNR